MSKYELPPEARELIDQVRDLDTKARRSEEAVRSALATLKESAEGLRTDRELFELLIRRPGEGFEIVAEAWADYERARTDRDAAALLLKPASATSAADAVRAKGAELAEARRRATLAEYLVALYERHFPWLEELRDQELEAAYVEGDTHKDDEDRSDPVARWVSAAEWRSLSTVERNQRALDRYLTSRKSAWQLGRDYERYVGYLREREGFSVKYHGIEMRFADLGRDLLAERDDTIEVIQCKRWARHKTIHEPYIFQLYGTMVLAGLENPTKQVTGTFTTTTTLSAVARRVAEHLGIKVEQSFPMGDYPRIKCNIARATDERIYHLPFDQQYDTTLVEPHRGEYWAATCAEAENLGFRRAGRWRAEGSTPQQPSV